MKATGIAERFEDPTDPPVARVHGRQRDAGHRRRECKRQIDERIDDAASRERIADQHPRDEHAEHHVQRCRRRRRADGQPVRRQRARGGDDVPELARRERRRLDEHAAERNQHQQAQVEQREPERRPEAGKRARVPASSITHRLRPGLIDLVEHAAIGEVSLLRLRPSAEHLVDGKEAELRKLLRILVRGRRSDRGR